MGRVCKPCGSGRVPTVPFRIPSTGGQASPDATQAATAAKYEVLDAKGKSIGRTFTSPLAASGFAKRIGGTTRPVK